MLVGHVHDEANKQADNPEELYQTVLNSAWGAVLRMLRLQTPTRAAQSEL